jgi:hypothetical protein
MSMHEGVEIRITIWDGQQRITVFQGDCQWLHEHCLVENMVPGGEWHGVMASSEGMVIEARPVILQGIPATPDDISGMPWDP